MLPTLTDREKQALSLLADGLLHKQVAHEMGISGETVKTFLWKARRKLNAKTNTHAVAICMEHGHLQAAPLDILAAHAAGMRAIAAQLERIHAGL